MPCVMKSSMVYGIKIPGNHNFSKRKSLHVTSKFMQTFLVHKKTDPLLNIHPQADLHYWRRHPDSNWRIEVLQTFALPLGYGANFWSGRRDSDPRHPPWQGGTLPLSYYRKFGASEWNRTTDTGIFSPLLYRLSYRGIKWRPGRGSNPRPPA